MSSKMYLVRAGSSVTYPDLVHGDEFSASTTLGATVPATDPTKPRMTCHVYKMAFKFVLKLKG